jgi:RNA polymerase sigma-70 factor (sigma-E family)
MALAVRPSAIDSGLAGPVPPSVPPGRAASPTVLPPALVGDCVADGERERNRDQQIGALFDEHYAGLCRLAALLLGDRAAAEEAVQEAFLSTYAGWWRIRRPERAQWYLRRAVVNQCRSRQRRRVSEDRGNRIVHHSDDLPPRSGEDPAAVIEAMAIADAVRALPPRQREAVVLRYYEDLSEADIAAVLGCSTGTVKSQLSKARASLATQLEGLREEVD